MQEIEGILSNFDFVAANVKTFEHSFSPSVFGHSSSWHIIRWRHCLSANEDMKEPQFNENSKIISTFQ